MSDRTRVGRGPLTWRRWLLATGAALALVVVAAVLGLAYGSSDAGGVELVSAWFSSDLDAHQETILYYARLPRVVFAVLVGAALASSGAVFQAVLRNPLADPYILGVAGGAALGGTVALSVQGLADLAFGIPIPAAAFVGALAAMGVIFAVGRWTPGGRMSTYVLLLTGVIVNAFASAVIMFFKSVVSPQKAQELLFYLMGSLSVEGATGSDYAVVAVATVGAFVAMMWFARDLDVLTLGDEEAASLGVDVDATRRWTVIAACVAVAACVAYTGLIGFVGLVVPHAVRLVFGPDHRLLLPTCALAGAAFLVLSDLAARASFGLFSTALPVGVVTAFVGAPAFLLLLRGTLAGGRA